MEKGDLRVKVSWVLGTFYYFLAKSLCMVFAKMTRGNKILACQTILYSHKYRKQYFFQCFSLSV